MADISITATNVLASGGASQINGTAGEVRQHPGREVPRSRGRDLMAGLGTVNIPVSEVAHGLTVRFRLTGLPVMRVRWWIAARLFAFAVWISGMRGEISIDELREP